DPTGATNAEVHRTGEVWCSMLWECYAALIADSPRLTFDQAQSRMKLYLIGGLKLTPNSPTLVEARDAILAAALANDPADFALMAQAFAKRGLGTGAVAPPRTSSDHSGVVESFAVGSDLTLASSSLTDDLHTCDDDSYLDNGERGTLSVSFVNTGVATLSGTSVTVTSTHPGVTFPAGNVFGAPATTPYTSATVSLPVDLTGAVPGELVEFSFAVDDPALLVPGPRVATLTDYVHLDEELSTSDLAETHHTTWTYGSAPGGSGEPWGRVEVAPGSHAYHVNDAGGIADLTLTSPPLSVSPSTPFSFTFQHRWSFEFDSGANYDGGVVELSNDGGTSWTDIGGLASTAYNGTLFSGSGNPLSGRSAWVQTNVGYPSNVSTTVNLANAYAGQTVRVRFRHAADAGVGGPGWWIDNLFFDGLSEPPFYALGLETGTCEPLAVGDPRPSSVSLSLTSGNPSRGTARLRFALPASQRARLTVHDLAGRLVATLADGEYSAGVHDAAFTRADGGTLPGAGVYFARLVAGERQYTQRLVVLR
ncbi:MAG: M36 family metallopeptidase, partial [Candidatus Eisenbacteria bacterium]|nr:M36 family metallopeptidase [Candidatus Eisenbacteria bacterium]